MFRFAEPAAREGCGRERYNARGDNDPMAWHPVCKIADLNPDDVTPFDVNGTAVAVCLVEGQAHAFHDLCSHEAVALADGFLEGSEIECPLHGARFCVKTGKCLTPPATEDIAVYLTKVEDGTLFVNLG